MASNRIKGITIELDGNTTKLQNALKGVESQISKTKASLRDVDKLLKLNPGNTDLLSQKQKYLAEAIDGTKEKLRQEKEALEQLKNAPATEETIRQQEALEREIVETENALESLTAEYKNFGSVSAQQLAQVGNKMQDIGNKMSSVGSTLTKSVTAPIMGIASASAVAWKEVDEAMDTVAVKTGATGDQLEAMQDIVSSLATEIPADFQAVGDAVGEVNTRFGVTGEELKDLSAQFLKFAEVNGTDVTSSIDSMQAAMQAFGVETKDAGKFLDMINKAGQDTGVSVDKLADLMKTNSEALKSMGMNASDSAMFLANLDKNGVDASTAIAGLKTALKNATKDGKTSKQALNDLQKEMSKATSKTEAMQKAMALFGAKAGPALGAAIYEGRVQLDSFGTSLDQFEGNLSKTFEETLDPADQLKLALNSLKETGAELFSTIQEVGAPLLKQLSESLKELNEKFKALSPEQKEMIVKIGAVAAAIGPLLMVLGQLTSSFGSILSAAPQIAGAFQKVTGALSAATGEAGLLGGAMSALPIAGVVAEIGVLTAALVTAYQTNDEFKAHVDECWASIKESFGQTALAFKEMGDGITSVLNALGFSFENFKEVASAAWEGFSGLLANNQIGPILQTITDALNLFSNECQLVFGTIGALLRGDWSEAWNLFKEAVVGAFDTVVSYLAGKVPIIGGYLREIIEALRKVKEAESEASRASGGAQRRASNQRNFASAMNHGVILSKPTIFGAQNGKYLQAGEAGDEVVVGANSLSSMIRASVPQTNMNDLSSVITDAVGTALSQYGITLEVEANKDGIFNSVVQSNSIYKKMHGGVGALA